MNIKRYECTGQMDINQWMSDLTAQYSFSSCGRCLCRDCLYWWTGRCPKGGCYDEYRSKVRPFNKEHPERTPRKAWSNWNKPGEQAHWCRGGNAYATRICDTYEEYESPNHEECINGMHILVYKDGYIQCSIKDNMGCEKCIEQEEGRLQESAYQCKWMTENGCASHQNAISLWLSECMDPKNNMDAADVCTKQCCIGCTEVCGYRCGAAGGR